MESVKRILLIIVVSQTMLGFLVIYYGSIYSYVDEKKAEEMLEFIRTNDPGYYEKLVNGEDPAYIREFNKHFTVRGNRVIILLGLFFLAVAINVSIPLAYLEVKERFGGRGEGEPGEEEAGEESGGEGGEEENQKE